MKKIFLVLLIIFNLLAVAYLLAPLPAVPDLIDSAKSDLPGDTVQIPHVSGYFTNLSRTEVMNFYKSRLNGLFRLQLNYPPEKARQIISDTTPSYYLEEFVFPFKESVFINGFDWQNDVFTKPEKRAANRLIYNNIEYQSKITVRTFPTSLPQRLAAFFGIEICILLIVYCYVSIFRRHD